MTNKVIIKMVSTTAGIVLFFVASWYGTTSHGLSIVPEILTYKTCVNSPPGFSEGCMDNVTVYPGGSATFNCQVDPRCHIQSLYWYHEGPSGESRLLKTGRNATEPYIHTINSAYDHHQGRYYCRIQNVMGINECSAYLIIRNSAVKTEHQCQYSVLIPILALLHWMH